MTRSGPSSSRAARALVPTGPGEAELALIDLDGGQASINQRQLRRQGLAGWQAATTAGLLTALDMCPRSGAFLDIGANAGLYSLLCKRLWPTMTAIAFEPFPATREAGERWAAANGVEIQFEALALSDQEGFAPLYVSAKSDASNSLVAGFREPSGTVTVALSTLDAYLQRTGIVPSVVKIDVEKHEPAVVRGARASFQRHTPVVVVELLASEGTLTESAREAHELLVALGYESRSLAGRDWLYWHGGIPAQFDERYGAWHEAVLRCSPVTG